MLLPITKVQMKQNLSQFNPNEQESYWLQTSGIKLKALVIQNEDITQVKQKKTYSYWTL